MMMKITGCQVNHFNNPLGFRIDGTPVFHWIVSDAAGTRATLSRIVISREDTASGERTEVADTGWTELDSLAASVNVALAPRTRYIWTVAVRTDTGEEGISAENFFETGKMEEGWVGRWIAAADEDEGLHPVFTKKIIPDREKEIAAARLYISAAGLYEAHWNGEKIGDEYLTPYCTNYNAWMEVISHDVTREVRQTAAAGATGELSICLGNGWYNGRFGFNPDQRPHFEGGKKLIAELHITYTDGSENVIGTDESWLATRSAITFSNIYDGEHRDDTLPKTPAQKAVLTGAPKGELLDRLSLPVVVKHVLPAKKLIHTPAGETVIDLGQNQAGIWKLHLHVPAGTKAHVQVGEVLQEGNFYHDNLRSAKAEYWYTSDGRETDLIPHFTFYGYRYVKIEGIPDLRPEDFTALVLYSDMDQTGSLTFGNEKINRLLLNAEWGKRSNFIDVPTDCPQRDERMGWTGDAEVFAPTALYQSDAYAFYTKYLFDMATEQKENGGMVPDVVPDFGVHSCACAWGDATTIIPWTMYQYTGDKSILEKHYESMKAWVDYVEKRDEDQWGWRDQFHYGDWLALDGGGAIDEVLGGTDEGFIAEVYKLYSAQIVHDTAALLGRENDAAGYQELADNTLTQIRREYFSPTGRSCIDTQTAYLLALRFGLSVDPDRMKERLIWKLKKNGSKLQTGFIGTPILAEGVTSIGHPEMAYDLLFNEEFPGWLYEVNLGATTIWERWNSMEADGKVSSTGMNSFNHYAYGSIAAWLYERAAGLRRDPSVPGFRKVEFAPLPNWKLKSAAATYQSAAGVWKTHWKILDEHTLEIALSVPFGCSAVVVLPGFDRATLAAGEANEAEAPNPLFDSIGADGRCHVGPGEYSITYRTCEPLRRIYSTRMPLNELLASQEAKAILMKMAPQILQVPKQYENMSLRDLAAVMNSTGTAEEEQFDRIDDALKNII